MRPHLHLFVSVSVSYALSLAVTVPARATHNDHDHTPNIHEASSTTFRWPGWDSDGGRTGTIYLSNLAFRGRLMIGAVQGGNPPGYAPGDSKEAGLGIFRISRDRERLKQLSSFKCHGTNQINVWGNLAFQGVMETTQTGAVGNPTDPCDEEGLRIYDISDPRKPKIAGFVEVACGVAPQTLMPAGRRVYVYLPSTCHDDTDNPFGVAPASELGVVRVRPHDPARSELVRLQSMLPMIGCDNMVVHVDRKLGACTGDQRFALFDLTDPAAPAPIPESMSFVGFVAGKMAFSWDGEYLAVGNGVTGRWTGSEPSVSLFNVEDPSKPVHVATWGAPAGPGRDNPVRTLSFIPMRDGRRILTIAHTHRGLWMLDVTDASSPVEFGHYIAGDTAVSYTPTDGFVSSAVAVHYYNGRLYFADTDKRLRVLRVNGLNERTVHEMRGAYNPQTVMSAFASHRVRTRQMERR